MIYYIILSIISFLMFFIKLRDIFKEYKEYKKIKEIGLQDKLKTKFVNMITYYSFSAVSSLLLGIFCIPAVRDLIPLNFTFIWFIPLLLLIIGYCFSRKAYRFAPEYNKIIEEYNNNKARKDGKVQ